MRAQTSGRRNQPSASPVRFRAAPGVGITWCDGQMVLVRHADHRRYRLNELAARIWVLLANGAPRRIIIAQLRRQFGAPSDWLEMETARVVERLLAIGLIERRTA